MVFQLLRLRKYAGGSDCGIECDPQLLSFVGPFSKDQVLCQFNGRVDCRKQKEMRPARGFSYFPDQFKPYGLRGSRIVQSEQHLQPSSSFLPSIGYGWFHCFLFTIVLGARLCSSGEVSRVSTFICLISQMCLGYDARCFLWSRHNKACHHLTTFAHVIFRVWTSTECDGGAITQGANSRLCIVEGKNDTVL